MEAFTFSRATSVPQAIASPDATTRFVAGGTTLIDLMKLNVERPARVVDINGLPLDTIEAAPGGGLKVGALVRNADMAQHPEVVAKYAVLSEALLSGASPQLRNMATTGGNLQQARAGDGLFGDRRVQSQPGDPGDEPGLHRDQSLRHERGADGARGHGADTRRKRRADGGDA
jgi:hypothetical protein